MAHMARQTRLAKELLILPDPLRIDELLAQLQQREAGAAPCLDMVAEQMNDVGDRDRLTARLIEMRGHSLQEHEWMIVEQDDPTIRTGEARSLGVEASKIGKVANGKGGD